MKKISKIFPSFFPVWACLVYLMLYLPILVMMISSFNNANHMNAWEGFTLKWYKAFFEDEEIIAAFMESLKIAFVSTTLASVLGTLTAVALREDLRKQDKRYFASTLVESILLMPVILPDIVLGIALLLLFIFMRLSLGTGTIVVAHASFTLAYVFLIVRVRLKGMDPTLEEAASDLGANAVTTFFKVTLPLLMPGILAGAMLAFTLSFEDFLITFFTAGVGINTLPLQIYSMLKFGISPVISALSTVFLLLTIVATLFTQKWKS